MLERWLAVSGTLLGALAGLWVGGRIDPVPPPASSGSHAVDGSSSPRVAPGATRPTARAPEGAGVRLPDVTEQAIRQERARFLTRWGRPPQAPEGARETVGRDAVAAVMGRYFEALGGELLDVDCTHYPCVALGVSVGSPRDLSLPPDFPSAWVANVSMDDVTGKGVYRSQIVVPAEPLDELETRFVWRWMHQQDTRLIDRTADGALLLREEAP